MSTTIHNHSAFGKFGEMLFTHQAPYTTAERHPGLTDGFSLAKLGAFFFTRQAAVETAERHQGLVNSYKSWRARRAAEAELSSLSDRELEDIGVSRSEIHEAVRNAAL
ncbi:MAG: hypothetical protein B7X08_07045 [Acidocella sp. 20-63-7]|nr:MAG: hypothetical protein B7X08_07045 [Acidocella sp. 20-63-7]HQT46393.1 DUF1127 domain-containing protein [Acidocella sp.]